MLGTEVLTSPRPELEHFLQATVGEDRNGHAVTVLSTLARLELDPWLEAKGLAEMGREAASARLGLLLSKFHDVPDLGHDHASVAWDLTLLLPQSPPAKSLSGPGLKSVGAGVLWSTSTWLALATVLILVLVKLTSG